MVSDYPLMTLMTRDTCHVMAEPARIIPAPSDGGITEVKGP